MKVLAGAHILGCASFAVRGFIALILRRVPDASSWSKLAVIKTPIQLHTYVLPFLKTLMLASCRVRKMITFELENEYNQNHRVYNQIAAS